MENKNFAQVLRESPTNRWLAFTEDESKIVATGETPIEAELNAKKEGVDDPLLVWAPENWTPRVF